MESILHNNRYFVLNNEGQILIFYNTTTTNNQHLILIPTFHSEYDSDLNELCTFFKKEACLLEEQTIPLPVMRNENGHLKKIERVCIKNFYTVYKALNEKEIQTILDICGNYNLEPSFISLEDLKKYYQENFDYSFNIKAIYKLERKLKYEEY